MSVKTKAKGKKKQNESSPIQLNLPFWFRSKEKISTNLRKKSIEVIDHNRFGEIPKHTFIQRLGAYIQQKLKK